MSSAPQTKPAIEKDFLPINGTDYIEFYVGNAKQSSYYYRAAFGFKLVAYAGLETGVRDNQSYVLQQDKIRFALTTPLLHELAIADHIKLHGDGVRDLASWVDDAESAVLALHGESFLIRVRPARCAVVPGNA